MPLISVQSFLTVDLLAVVAVAVVVVAALAPLVVALGDVAAVVVVAVVVGYFCLYLVRFSFLGPEVGSVWFSDCRD